MLFNIAHTQPAPISRARKFYGRSMTAKAGSAIDMRFVMQNDIQQ